MATLIKCPRVFISATGTILTCAMKLGASPDFNPKLDNWRRSARVPILLLNATALNTGHNWQFAATWMGEPPPGPNSVDSNDVLRRMYYEDEAPARYRKVPLGLAVTKITKNRIQKLDRKKRFKHKYVE